jgi:hypothetical protein
MIVGQAGAVKTKILDSALHSHHTIDAAAFKRRSGGTRAVTISPIADYYLAVGADIHEKGQLFPLMYPAAMMLGDDISADVAQKGR